MVVQFCQRKIIFSIWGVSDNETMPGIFNEYYLVAAGGFAGALARYVLNGVIPGMPGTLAINVAGCLFLGFIMYESAYSGAFSPRARIICGAGFLGAFTTFSTFELQTFQASPGIAIANILASLILGLAAVLVGRQLAIRRARGG
jgi:fluoride exporter